MESVIVIEIFLKRIYSEPSLFIGKFCHAEISNKTKELLNKDETELCAACFRRNRNDELVVLMILKLETDSYALLFLAVCFFVVLLVYCICVGREVVGKERIFAEGNVIYAMLEVLV